MIRGVLQFSKGILDSMLKQQKYLACDEISQLFSAVYITQDNKHVLGAVEP